MRDMIMAGIAFLFCLAALSAAVLAHPVVLGWH